MLGVVIFLSVFVLFFMIMNSKSEPELKDLDAYASAIKSNLDKDPALFKNDELNLTALQNLTYEELRNRFGLKGEFCIVLEDDNGSLFWIKNDSAGIGSGEIFVGRKNSDGSLVPCSP